jgi:hypothetical protein
MTGFLHDAEFHTESWKRRHSPEAIAQLGVWRWKGMQQHAGRILDLICGKRVIDFGGADGPLGFGSVVVDEKAKHKTINEVDGQVDVIFTSHTLEHLEGTALPKWMLAATTKLRYGGYLILHVPALTCKRWRHDVYHNPRQPNGHKHTFTLDGQDSADATNICSEICNLDIELAEYVGDDSILVIARKP